MPVLQLPPVEYPAGGRALFRCCRSDVWASFPCSKGLSSLFSRGYMPLGRDLRQMDPDGRLRRRLLAVRTGYRDFHRHRERVIHHLHCSRVGLVELDLGVCRTLMEHGCTLSRGLPDHRQRRREISRPDMESVLKRSSRVVKEHLRRAFEPGERPEHNAAGGRDAIVHLYPVIDQAKQKPGDRADLGREEAGRVQALR
jgi:hypothetical protein